jgi:hypothetical protein
VRVGELRDEERFNIALLQSGCVTQHPDQHESTSALADDDVSGSRADGRARIIAAHDSQALRNGTVLQVMGQP